MWWNRLQRFGIPAGDGERGVGGLGDGGGVDHQERECDFEGGGDIEDLKAMDGVLCYSGN